ncbi:tetratricopeptide repeat protein [Hyphomonas sp.]|uniref:tetratricopeptide repeat protein n=1 Tax=Hyphomonas sp. TaxID=87 RepID=UPI00391C3586
MRRLPTRLPNRLAGAALAGLLLVPASCAGLISPVDPAYLPAAAPAATPERPVSGAAMALARRNADGELQRYPTGEDAVRAGDAAGLVRTLHRLAPAQRDAEGFNQAFLALDRAADSDFTAAREALGITGDESTDTGLPGFYIWLDAWFFALEGEPDEALTRHREVAISMPGLTADLSLAALLEASGRPDEALAVYEALTPSRIEAPEHEFDVKGLMFAQVSTVIVRHALLLQRLGRIEEAQAVYQQLADAQPEQATSYAAAIESLATGRNLDNKPLTFISGFSQSLSDVSVALQQQRYLSRALLGLSNTGFDSQRAAFDLMILVIDPEARQVRSGLVGALHEQALYKAAAHVAQAAPAQTATLQLAAAQALLMSGDEAGARAAISTALADASDEDRLQTVYGALRLSALLNDRDKAMSLLPEVLSRAGNPAERAAANGLAASILDHFGEAERAVEHAREARQLDDTHDRRMALANYLGRAGLVTEGLGLLRTERLARPDDPYTLNSLGYFLITRTDRYEEGYRILARALMLAETNPYIADSVGWALYRLGDIERARRIIESVRAELLPQRNWEVEDHLGDIFWHSGDEDEARRAWQHALDNHPPHAERRLIEAKLAGGLETPAPERRPIPEIRMEDLQPERRGI